MIDWNKFATSDLFAKIKHDWKILLENDKLQERHYHEFIREFPYLFLNMRSDSYLSISKLKLGSEFETDFVIVKEGYSDGTIYELIEIESPHTKLFDKKGKPTAKFNAAMQQIRDWRRWLIDNKSQFKKIFPSTSTRVLKDSRLRFKIIIGRREENSEVLKKRRQISEENNIEIMSFDRLTDFLEMRTFFLPKAQIYSAQMDSVPSKIQNELANPFYTCHGHSEWMKVCNKGVGAIHFYSKQYKKIIETRKLNKYYTDFIKKYGS